MCADLDKLLDYLVDRASFCAALFWNKKAYQVILILYDLPE